MFHGEIIGKPAGDLMDTFRFGWS